MLHKFSIIIPTLNEEKFIDQCLTAIDNLDWPKDSVEVIVVDNGSKDATINIAQRYNAKIFIKEGCNVSELRNFGASMAVHNVLAFVDADCSVPRHWLRQAHSLLDLNCVGAVGCWYKVPENPTWVEKVWDIHMRERRNRRGIINWVPSGNFIIYRDVFNQINGFDESLITSEDVDICNRIRSLDLFVYTHPNLAIEHLGESNSIEKYFRKESWRGEGVYQNFLRHLPRLQLNKALALAFLTVGFCAGIIVGECIYCLLGDLYLLEISVAGLIAVPLLLSFKTLAAQRQWKYFLPLAFLFFLYSIARATSFLKPRAWHITSSNGTKISKV